MSKLVFTALIAGQVAIIGSDSVGGFCFRAAIAAPLYWMGVIDQETATFIALPYGDNL
jgi:hypothetical protein